MRSEIACIELLLWAVVTTNAAGQVPQMTSGPDVTVGFGVGLGTMPASFPRGCSLPLNGQAGAIGGHAHVGAKVGRVTTDFRLSAQGRPLPGGAAACDQVIPEQSDGFDESVEYPGHAGGYSAADARLMYGLDSMGRVSVGLGAGWVLNRELPFLVGALGLRTGGPVAFTADLELDYFRVPIEVVRREWASGGIVREVDRRGTHDWRPGRMVRLGVDFAVR